MTQPTTARRVAVIGSGVAGLTAAYVCSADAQVTLFEADTRLGGHADTHRVLDPSGRELGIDTGFIVHNERTYPVLLRLFAELGVATQESEMSMSMADDTTGVTWAGARGLGGLVPSGGRRHLGGHLRMLRDVPRFHRAAKALLEQEEDGDLTTLADFLAQGGFSAYFVRHFMEPLVAAVWSCDPELAGDYPARYLFSFLDHHGMLSVSGSPTWRTVTGGSGVYVGRVAAALEGRGGRIRLGSPVDGVLETESGVEVTSGGVRETFDQVVIAVHPHQALAMLDDASPLHKEVLGAITYSPNTAVLHTDASLLPRADRLKASWNFRRRREGAGPVTITYDLTRLQRLPTEERYLVTLGGDGLVDPSRVIDVMSYEHPLYTPESVAAQRRLPELSSDRIAFAGAYHGWGFHEDGARSGLAAAERLGHAWGAAEPQEDTGPTGPTLYRTTVEHTRRRPWRRTFRLRSWFWVVDLDELPAYDGPLGGLRRWAFGSVQARDHLGDPEVSVRENLARFLRSYDIELGDARVRMAAHPRAFGHCFNPISVFWCTERDGTPLATVVEVHNTYGDRHAYLLHQDAHGAAVTKQMYVSPFHGVDGAYRVAAPEPGEQLEITVVLRTEDGATFTATSHGTRTASTTRARLACAAVGIRDSALIRVHGIVLLLRGLRIQPRPTHHQEGVR